jgi:hypothetical protein
MIKVVGGCMLDSSKPRDSKRRTVDGLPYTCDTRAVTTCKSLAGHPPPFRTNNIARHRRCWIVGWSHQRLPGSLLVGIRGF